MSGYSFVTSMSLKGYEDYGRNFIESFDKHCSLPLYLWSEDDLPVPAARLQSIPDWVEFQNYPKDPPDWKYQAKRFSHKVFPATLPLDYAWWIWLDADVEVFGDIDEEFLSRVCPEEATLSYLGRKDWRTSECGWVAYNLNNGGRKFLDRFREIYTSGEIFDHLEWHDSYIFDRVMEELPGTYHNLSEGIEGMHPWDESPLGEKMKHFKGPLRKQGKSLDHLPEQYRSAQE